MLRATFSSTSGDILALGIDSGNGMQTFPYDDIPNVAGLGYLPSSDRIPGPDEFFPWFGEWFFFEEDGGPLLPGETLDVWVSYLDLLPGSVLSFTATVDTGGPVPELLQFGHVVVVPEPATASTLAFGLLLLRGLVRRERKSSARSQRTTGPCCVPHIRMKASV